MGFRNLTPPAASARRAVSAEHERRLERGILVGGAPFRCDNEAVSRIGWVIERLSLPDAPSTVTFPTHAGTVLTVTKAQAEAVKAAMLVYADDLFGASAAMQQASPIPADPADDAHWPARPSVAFD